MNFEDLGLWKEEEALIHLCLTEALNFLINTVEPTEVEDSITGKLHKLLLNARKRHRLRPIAVRQLAVYAEISDAKPEGLPDIGFLWDDSDHNQIEYHVECKRLSYVHTSQCKDYVGEGVLRYHQSLYGKDKPSGTMIGYVQSGDLSSILNKVNEYATKHRIGEIQLETWHTGGTSSLRHILFRPENFDLTHLWVDLRPQ